MLCNSKLICLHKTSSQTKNAELYWYRTSNQKRMNKNSCRLINDMIYVFEQTMTMWWFEPISNTLVSPEIFPKNRGKKQQQLLKTTTTKTRPFTSCCCSSKNQYPFLGGDITRFINTKFPRRCEPTNKNQIFLGSSSHTRIKNHYYSMSFLGQCRTIVRRGRLTSHVFGDQVDAIEMRWFAPVEIRETLSNVL